jgi:hypothetical protein
VLCIPLMTRVQSSTVPVFWANSFLSLAYGVLLCSSVDLQGCSLLEVSSNVTLVCCAIALTQPVRAEFAKQHSTRVLCLQRHSG